jgi:hypothetical protein
VPDVNPPDAATLKHLIASDIPADEVRIVDVDLDPSGMRALVAAIYNPDDAAYEAVVTLNRADARWVSTNENFGFGGGLATFPGINDDADFVEVPFLVASVSEPCATTAVVSYRGHEARRPITDGFVVAAFWDQSEAASSEPAFEPGDGPLTATVEFIPEHELPPAPELPRIERYEYKQSSRGSSTTKERPARSPTLKGRRGASLARWSGHSPSM